MNKPTRPSGLTGLTTREAQKRLLAYGENTVYHRKRMRPVIAFFEKFKSPLLVILIVAASISFFLGERASSIIILLMVLLSAILDFANSYRSEKAIKTLISRVATTATVLRDGIKQDLAFKQLVPGDVIFLSAGDVVPADAELAHAEDFFVNQAALTGESFPVEKFAPDDHTTEQDATIVFMGTSVTTGSATAVIKTTGATTEFGKIAQRLNQEAPETDFDRGIKSFSYFIMKITVLLVFFVFLIHTILGHDMFGTFLFAVSVAVGVTPELLPMIISVTLSRGSMIMAEKNVIVKYLHSIQNFGSMNILCTDKTGTLTEDRIVLVNYLDSFGKVYEPIFLYSYISSALHTGIRSPLDTAIADHRVMDIATYKKIDEIPFDFERKRGSIVVRHEENTIMITKGAPEDVLRACISCEKEGGAYSFDPALSATVAQRYHDLSAEGFRALGVAIKELPAERRTYSPQDEADMTFLGFIVFLDPPKATVSKTIQDLAALGIEIKILTGDSDILTQKICRDINLVSKGTLTGTDIGQMNDAELMHHATNTTIFARINPEQKERIILALKRIGNVVGFLGDGINDAPALRAADVGISVNNAVDVAKETASIILLDKSLRVLHDGVIEGRKTFHNTMKYILMGLSSNFGNMLSMTAASIFVPFLPMLPPQILLNNFLYDSSQITLPSDSVDRTDIGRPPKWDLHFLKRFMIVFGIMSSVFDFITYGLLLYVFKLPEHEFQTGWFIESLATQVFVIYVIRTKKVPFLQSAPSAWLAATTVGMVLLGWAIPFTPLANYFRFAPLNIPILLSIATTVIVYLIFVEIAKRMFYRHHRAT